MSPQDMSQAIHGRGTIEAPEANDPAHRLALGAAGFAGAGRIGWESAQIGLSLAAIATILSNRQMGALLTLGAIAYQTNEIVDSASTIVDTTNWLKGLAEKQERASEDVKQTAANVSEEIAKVARSSQQSDAYSDRTREILSRAKGEGVEGIAKLEIVPPPKPTPESNRADDDLRVMREKARAYQETVGVYVRNATVATQVLENAGVHVGKDAYKVLAVANSSVVVAREFGSQNYLGAGLAVVAGLQQAFGRREGQDSHMKAVFEQLAVINRQLNEVLDNQKKIIEKLDELTQLVGAAESRIIDRINVAEYRIMFSGLDEELTGQLRLCRIARNMLANMAFVSDRHQEWNSLQDIFPQARQTEGFDEVWRKCREGLLRASATNASYLSRSRLASGTDTSQAIEANALQLRKQLLRSSLEYWLPANEGREGFLAATPAENGVEILERLVGSEFATPVFNLREWLNPIRVSLFSTSLGDVSIPYAFGSGEDEYRLAGDSAVQQRMLFARQAVYTALAQAALLDGRGLIHTALSDLAFGPLSRIQRLKGLLDGQTVYRTGTDRQVDYDRTVPEHSMLRSNLGRVIVIAGLEASGTPTATLKLAVGTGNPHAVEVLLRKGWTAIVGKISPANNPPEDFIGSKLTVRCAEGRDSGKWSSEHPLAICSQDEQGRFGSGMELVLTYSSTDESGAQIVATEIVLEMPGWSYIDQAQLATMSYQSDLLLEALDLNSLADFFSAISSSQPSGASEEEARQQERSLALEQYLRLVAVEPAQLQSLELD
ncbi:MAG: hypothetical protein KDB22_23950 [Planctomycetales bacterium]|nr:hypothetical protein [Planctomycetales bacterium]